VTAHEAFPKLGNRPDVLLVSFIVRSRLGKRLPYAGSDACEDASETP